MKMGRQAPRALARAKSTAAPSSAPSSSTTAPASSASELPESLLWKCPICLDTLHEPMLTTCCGQSFCRECLDAALAKVDTCPMCRAPLLSGSFSMTRNRALEELLSRMKISDDDDASEHQVLLTIRDTNSQATEPKDKPTGVSRLHRLRSGAVVVAQRVRSACLSAVQLQQWRHWIRIHWATLQCVFYVFLFGVFVFFLRVQEEEFADHDTNGPRNRLRQGS